MKSRILTRVLLPVALMIVGAGTCAGQTTIETVLIGSPGNAADDTGHGSVGYEFRISKYEVTNAQYVDFLNAVATVSDPNGLFNPLMESTTWGGIVRLGSEGNYTYFVKPNAIGKGPGGTDYSYANKPVVFVCYADAIRFTNWMTSGNTEVGNYEMVYGFVPDHATLTTGWFLPNVEEWYKAAYYDPNKAGGAGYWDFPMGTDERCFGALPADDNGDTGNFRLRNGGLATGGDDNSYPFTDVGAYTLSGSPFGTFDQGGSVWEWNETYYSAARNGLQGGSWINSEDMLRNTVIGYVGWNEEKFDWGFRIACPNVAVLPSFKGTAFEQPMGNTKKVGSTIPVKFRLFCEEVPVTSQAMLDGILVEYGLDPAGVQIQVFDVTDPGNTVGPLPVFRKVGKKLTDCFKFGGDGKCSFEVQIGKTVFKPGSKYLVQVKIGESTVQPENQYFYTAKVKGGKK